MLNTIFVLVTVLLLDSENNKYYQFYVYQRDYLMESLKTRMCIYHVQGRCKYGHYCTFAHDRLELREAPFCVRKTKMCPAQYSGLCSNESCNFAHSIDELKSRPSSDAATAFCVSPAESNMSSMQPDYFDAMVSLLESMGSLDN